jgi:hypothetical protein
MHRVSSLHWLMGRFRPSMKKSPKFAIFAVVLASLPLTGVSRPVADSRGGLCCLCMCHSVDETQCSRDCIRMQHGTKIVEEPEMKACTKTCLKQGVRQIFFSEDGTRFIVTPSAGK